MKFTKFVAIAAAAFAVSGCTRIETGEVGVRIGFDRQVKMGELQPGSFNQTILGDVLTFPVKDVQVDVLNMTPLASDNSTVSDFDMAVVYSINPQSVSELYVNKNRAFHAESKTGDILLMYNYVYTAARNAAYKAARKYESLKLSDNRDAIEKDVLNTMNDTFKDEKLDGSIVVTQVLVRQIMPDAKIVQSANALVQAQNEMRRKEVEVQTAKLEAERISALNENKGAIAYMQAMALVNVSEAIKEGKVKAIVVPYDFKGIVDVRAAQ